MFLLSLLQSSQNKTTKNQPKPQAKPKKTKIQTKHHPQYESKEAIILIYVRGKGKRNITEQAPEKRENWKSVGL